MKAVEPYLNPEHEHLMNMLNQVMGDLSSPHLRVYDFDLTRVRKAEEQVAEDTMKVQLEMEYEVDL